MGLVDKLQELMGKVEAMKDEAQKLEQGSDAGVDLSKLQDQIKALADERDKRAKEAADLRQAIQAELDDAKTDTDRLAKALEPIEDVKVEAPVPEVKTDEGQPQEQGQPIQAQESNAPRQDLVDVANP